MTAGAELLNQALELPPDDRVKLVLNLLRSLEDGRFESPVSPNEWEVNLRRRIERVESGEATLIDTDDAMQQLREAHRQRAQGTDS